MVCRRSRKRSCARNKFIITRASKHAARFLARSRRFLFGSFLPFLFSTPSLSVYLSTRPIASAFRDAHRLSIKNFIIRSRSSFDFYRAAPGKRQVRNVVRFFPHRNLLIPLRRSLPCHSISLPRYLISN